MDWAGTPCQVIAVLVTVEGAYAIVQFVTLLTCVQILYGPNPSKVDSLAFSIRHPYLLQTNEVPNLDNLRLFSAGGGSELVEWDLQRGTVMVRFTLSTIYSRTNKRTHEAYHPLSRWSNLVYGCQPSILRTRSRM